MNKKTKPTKEQENPLKEIEELLDKQNENLRELMKTIETINIINNLFLQTDNQLGEPSQEEKERREKEREEHCEDITIKLEQLWEDTLIFDLWGIKRHPNFSIEKMAEIMKEELSGDEIMELVLRLIS